MLLYEMFSGKVTCLFFQNSHSIKKKTPVMCGKNPDGVEISRSNLLDSLEVIIPIV